MNAFKSQLIHALQDRGVYFRAVNNVQYVTRCPSCGDKVDNLNTGHLYIRIDPSDDSAIVFKCHRCPYHGILTEDDLDMLGVGTNSELKEGLSTFNKYSSKYDSKNIANKKEVSYNFDLPDVVIGPKTDYINQRLGLDLNSEELKRLKVITSFGDFLNMNKITSLSCEKYMARNLHNNYVGFLTSSGSHILFRDVTEKQKFRWVKYTIFPTTQIQDKAFYAVPRSIDVMTTEPVIINLAEGVMDILSIAFNLGNDRDNILNFAVCGKYYDSMIIKLIHMGLVGDNIHVNIFSDNDKTFDTSLKYYKMKLEKYRPLFKSMTVYYNKLSKDCGVPKDQIMLDPHRI